MLRLSRRVNAPAVHFSFIRTVTVGSGFPPDLPDPSDAERSRALPESGNTAGGDFHPALKTSYFVVHPYYSPSLQKINPPNCLAPAKFWRDFSLTFHSQQYTIEPKGTCPRKGAPHDAETTCCFSGHRPPRLPWGSNEADPRCLALKARLASAWQQRMTKGTVTFSAAWPRGRTFTSAKRSSTCVRRTPM